MTRGTTDSIRFYYAMLRKGMQYLSKIEESSFGAREAPSIGIMKECANELGIEVEELVDGAFELKTGNVTKMIANFDTLEKGSACWLASNKYATFEILKKNGFQQLPYHRRYSLATINEARKDFLERKKAVVIKPSRGTFGGTGVTVNIQSIGHLNKAIFNSLVYDGNYLMEDFIEGDNFRILFYEEKMVSAVQRLPANVKGDGINNIKRLIEAENERREKEQGLFRLYPISINNDVKQTLFNKKISLNYVPSKDERVFVRTICNHHAGGETRDVTSLVHPDIVRDCENIMRIIGLTVGGIDIITEDISRPLAEMGGVVNEVNADPALDIHEKTVTMNLLRLMFGRNMI